MRLFFSLRTRIFLASALLAVLSIGVALFVVNVRVTREAEATMRREITATGNLVDQLRTSRTETFSAMARLVAEIPQLTAAVDTNDPQTVQDLAEDYQRKLKSNLLLATNKNGAVLASVGASARAADVFASQPAVREALAGHERVSLLPQASGMMQLVTVPIGAALRPPIVLGTLSVGFLLDDAVAAELKATTGSDVAFGMDGQILASTIGRADRPSLASLLHAPGPETDVRIGGTDYVVLQRQLTTAGDGDSLAGGPVALILRSRTEELAGLKAIQAALGVTALVAVILATLVSFAVARTIAQPVAAVTAAMREVAATGDLTRKIVLEKRRWEDEDARVMMTTFNTLTDSIARFQREMSQKERLSSLGRLSTVIAHEIRNPLMIIKASLHALRQPSVSAEALREAALDIDDEVARLNRVVNEVLDFARPVKFELAPADINLTCRESAGAVEAAGAGPPAQLALDPRLPMVTTDAERLRGVLVNMLLNARHAVAERKAAPAGPAITLRTAVRGDRIAITIEDRGVGIDPATLSRMFDPYFTTRRGGTGLGLAIAKNIIEGLHGTVTASSAPDAGTSLEIELPVGPPAPER